VKKEAKNFCLLGGAAVDEAAALGRLGLGGAITGLTRLTGGASLQTWCFDAGDRRLILRRRTGAGEQPNGAALALGTEAALLRLAGDSGVPVPAVVRICTPEDGLDEALILTHICGETLGRRIVAGDAFAAIRPALGGQAGIALARIHQIDPVRLPDLPVLGAAETLAHYQHVYRESGAVRPVLDVAFQLLARALPPPVPPRLVHGDFRTGNLMVDPARGLVAVLDWELAHLGDPAEDIGWLCVNSWRFGAVEKQAGGFATLAEICRAYETAGGACIDVARIRFWHMLGSLKWAVMCLIMYGVFVSGADASVERAAIGRRVSECEADLLALIEAAA
jgi:aminoglycoside phosphotransferase (APT) family kinase protein